MRAGSRGVTSQSAFVIVALTDNAQMTSTTLGEQFQAVGYEIVEQPRISRTRSDRAIVLHAYAPGLIPQPSSSSSTNDLATSVFAAGLAVAHVQNGTLRQQILSSSPTVTWPSFQPVWNVRRWCCTGLELFVVDDDDAFQQLDVLAQGLGCTRREITIKPRVGWQDYGHPAVHELG